MTFQILDNDRPAWKVKCTDRGCYFTTSDGKPTDIPSAVLSMVNMYVTIKKEFHKDFDDIMATILEALTYFSKQKEPYRDYTVKKVS